MISGICLTLMSRVANWVSLVRQLTEEEPSTAKDMGGFGWIVSAAAETNRPLAYARSLVGVPRTVLMLRT